MCMYLINYSLNLKSKAYRFSAILVLMLLLNVTIAGEVILKPSVSIKESYTDNVLLAPKGQETGEFVTTVSPAFSLLMKGSHFKANVDYTMQNLFYQKESSRNNIYHQLSAKSTSELVDDNFFIDFNANRSQQIINADSPVGSNNIAVTGNKTDVSNYIVEPYLKYSFFNKTDLLLRYTYSAVDYRRDESVDSEQNGEVFKLNSSSKLTGISWQLYYSRKETDYDTGSDSEFKKGSILLGYRFSTRAHVYGTVGKDENTFFTVTNQSIDDSFWNAGIDMKAGSRDSFTLTYGERFFGHTGSLHWQHNARRLKLNANYREELSNSALSLIDLQQSDTLTEQSRQIDTSNSITSEVFVKERSSISAIYTFSKTSIKVSYSNELRKFQETGDQTRINNASFSVLLRSSSIMSYILATRWNRNYTASSGEKIFTSFIDFSINRRLSPRLTAVVLLSHGNRHSTIVNSDYDENIVTVGLTQAFN